MINFKEKLFQILHSIFKINQNKKKILKNKKEKKLKNFQLRKIILYH